VASLIRGFLLGFAIAASPGPMFFLCLRRTLDRGWVHGLVSGLGVATGDGFYGGLAAFGVATITTGLMSHQRWLTLAGGVGFTALGIRSLLAGPARPETRAGANPAGLVPSYLSTTGLTIANPATILTFTAVFAASGLRAGGGYAQQILLVAGVLLGSAGWWLILTSAASLLRGRLTPPVIRGVSILSALIILSFGLLAMASSFRATGAAWRPPL
jgi:threonine/homoserine/homoserine lactone efflux protein